MPEKVTVLGSRSETPAEQQLDAWLNAQMLETPKHLDEAARLLIGLVSGLLGVLLAVLALAEDPTPAYLAAPAVRLLGLAASVLLLVGLLAGLGVVWPRAWGAASGVPASQRKAFAGIVAAKARCLMIAIVLFGAGIFALAGLIVVIIFIA